MAKPIPSIVCALGLVSACGFVDFDTVREFADLSPLTADPAEVTVFLDLPQGLGILPGSANVTFGADRSDSGESDREIYILQTVEIDGLTGLRIDPVDWPKFRGQQLRLRAWEAEAPRATEGVFAVDGEPCAFGPGPAPTATASVFVQLASGDGRRPLIDNAPVSSWFSTADLAALPPCG
ncbi:hypothetical protein [Shimia ponticola]|uniref:hypothetical protein n=1 Tax=Shimia ponticola TaxID=2582893 RepID=UPI0011BFD06F|nr:hypothetical protein [Shimia ponticola]